MRGQSMILDFSRVGITAISTLVFSIYQFALAQADLEKTTVAYRKVDGHETLADVYRRRGNIVRPVIVYIHGGPTTQ